MTILTPKGQKINLKTNYCFALLARLSPAIDPYKVVTTAEAFGYMQDVLILLMIPIFLIFGVDFSTLIVCTLIVLLFEGLAEKIFWLGLIKNKVLNIFLSLSKIYRYIHVFQVSTIVFLWTGYHYLGWIGILISFGSLLLVKLMVNVLSFLLGPIIISRTNMLGIRNLRTSLSGSDKNFLNAYLFFARKSKRPLRLNVYVWELESDYWSGVYNKLFSERPLMINKINQLKTADLL